MKEKIRKIFCDKYIFLKLYIIVSVIMIVYRLIWAIIDEEVLLDNLRVNFQNYLFGSLFYVEHYLIVTFESVGPAAILLILHFGLLIEEKICEVVKTSTLSIIIMPIVGVVFYIVFRILFDCALPFSLMEGIAFAMIFYTIDKMFGIREKVCGK